MKIQKKKIDIIRKINKNKNIITENTKLIDNLFMNQLYLKYILSFRKKKRKNLFDLINEKPENKKIVQKIIINSLLKKIPPDLVQYFSDFELKKFADNIISSSSKKKRNKSKPCSSPKNKTKAKIYSRNVNNNLNYENTTYNGQNKTNIFNFENRKDLFGKKINQKKIFNSNLNSNSSRGYSAYIPRNNNNIYTNENETKDIFENKIMNNNTFNNNKKLYFTVSSKNNNSIFNTNNSINIMTNDSSIIKPKSSNNLKRFINNKETNKSNNIDIYNYMNKKNTSKKKILLNLSNNSIEKEKKCNSRVLTENNINNIKTNFFLLPKKNDKYEFNLLSPKEKVIIENASNITCNLKEIKREIKAERKQKPNKNIKYMIGKIKKDKKNLETKFLFDEVNKKKNYDYYMNNKKYMEEKNEVFKVLRNSFITERTRKNSHQISFIKTLNNICDEENHFDVIVEQVYNQNYWLRLNKNKKSAEKIKIIKDKMDSKNLLLNKIINKINKFNKD